MVQITEIRAEILTGGDLVNCVVRVRDSDGAEGVGEAWWGIADPDPAQRARAARPIASVVDDLLAPRAVGRDPRRIERLWYDLWDWGYRYADQGIFAMGLSGLDLALWDLAGRRAGQPVCALLGGPVAETIPAYASLPPLRQPDRVVGESLRAVEHGFGAVKLHELDPELVALVRREVGDEIGIMVDVNGHFDPIEAVALGRRLAEIGVVWFEEPVRPMRDHQALALIGARTGCDLAAGENEYTVDDFRRLLADGGLTYLQPEITKIGGLTPARRVAALAEEANVALCPHNFRLGPALYASIHWAFTSPASRWIEVPWVPEGVRFSHPAPLPALVGGAVAAPTEPGWGLAQT